MGQVVRQRILRENGRSGRKNIVLFVALLWAVATIGTLLFAPQYLVSGFQFMMVLVDESSSWLVRLLMTVYVGIAIYTVAWAFIHVVDWALSKD